MTCISDKMNILRTIFKLADTLLMVVFCMNTFKVVRFDSTDNDSFACRVCVAKILTIEFLESVYHFLWHTNKYRKFHHQLSEFSFLAAVISRRLFLWKTGNSLTFLKLMNGDQMIEGFRSSFWALKGWDFSHHLWHH